MKNIIICGTTEVSKTLKKKLSSIYDFRVTYYDGSIAYSLDAQTIFYHIQNADLIFVDIDTKDHPESFEPYFIAGVARAYGKFVIGVTSENIAWRYNSIGYSDAFLTTICSKVYTYENILQEIGELF